MKKRKQTAMTFCTEDRARHMSLFDYAMKHLFWDIAQFGHINCTQESNTWKKYFVYQFDLLKWRVPRCVNIPNGLLMLFKRKKKKKQYYRSGDY